VKKAMIIGVLGILVISCASAGRHASVDTVLASATHYDGKRITVRGVLSSRHGLLNLFTRRAEQCLGLILTPAERVALTRYVEREISLIGIFHAEGCGRDGICDEHLCGPGVLTHVSLLDDNSRK
jgi:hypothetical protein